MSPPYKTGSPGFTKAGPLRNVADTTRTAHSVESEALVFPLLSDFTKAGPLVTFAPHNRKGAGFGISSFNPLY
jgi:hypothetical protein